MNRIILSRTRHLRSFKDFKDYNTSSFSNSYLATKDSLQQVRIPKPNDIKIDVLLEKIGQDSIDNALKRLNQVLDMASLNCKRGDQITVGVNVGIVNISITRPLEEEDTDKIEQPKESNVL